MHAASASGAISPPTVGNISAGAGGDNWASAWHDSGKMNVSSGSSNRSAVSSPPAPAAAAPNPFTASNVAQLNTSPWPSSSGKPLREARTCFSTSLTSLGDGATAAEGRLL